MKLWIEDACYSIFFTHDIFSGERGNTFRFKVQLGLYRITFHERHSCLLTILYRGKQKFEKLLFYTTSLNEPPYDKQSFRRQITRLWEHYSLHCWKVPLNISILFLGFFYIKPSKFQAKNTFRLNWLLVRIQYSVNEARASTWDNTIQ